MLFQLGDFVFEGLKMPASWGLNFSTTYAQVPVLGGKPVVQRTGEKLVEQEISVLFSDEFCTPAKEMDLLQSYRRNGNILQMSGGDGTNYGRYVITDIGQVNERVLDSTGYISAISATIKLLEYNNSAGTAVNQGAALKSRNLKPVTPLTPTLFQAADLQQNLTAGKQVSANVSSASKTSAPKFSKISKMAAQAKESFRQANDKVQKTKKIYYRAASLKGSIDKVCTALEDVKAAADINDVNDLLSANTVLERAIYEMNGASAPLTGFIASREAGI